jgi:predicted 3-demethylubiquinone-9 3-methyltransferase (glyoxalase superfamily)
MTAMETTRKITPYLWFDGRAREAMTFYTGIFKKKFDVAALELAFAG